MNSIYDLWSMFAFMHFVLSVWSSAAVILTYPDFNHCRKTLSANFEIDLENFPYKLFSFQLISFFSLVLLFFPVFLHGKILLNYLLQYFPNSTTVHCIQFSAQSVTDINPLHPKHLLKYNPATLLRGRNKPLHVNIFLVFLSSSSGSPPVQSTIHALYVTSFQFH